VLAGGAEGAESIGLEGLIQQMRSMVTIPQRNPEGSLHFAVDHCFTIKGKGTVLTGTVLQGTIKVNDDIQLPELKVTKKVKSMQIFKKPVTKASQGDRAAGGKKK
jgi:selenocysteine-specific elongation factor